MLEILLAIFIMGIVLTTVYGAYTTTLRIVGDTDHADEIYGMARSAVEQIARDLESACRYEGAFMFLSKEQEDIGEKSFMSLDFVSSRHLSFERADGGIAEVAYYAVKKDNGEGYALLRKDVLLQRKEGAEEEREEEFLSPEDGYIICDKIEAFRWSFFDLKGEEHETWDSRQGPAEEKGRIPAVARVQIDFMNPADPENPYRFVTKIFIPASESQK